MLRSLVMLCIGGCLAINPVDAQSGLVRKYYEDVPVARVKPGIVRDVGKWIDGKLHLTEREAIQLALENNLNLNVERHNRLLRNWDLAKDRVPYEPLSTFGFSWDRSRTPAASILQGGDSVTDILTDYNLGFSQLFHTGTKFEITFKGNRNRTTNFFTSLIPTIQTQFELLFRQNLLEGFGKADAEYDLEIGRNNVDLSDQQFYDLVLGVVSQVQDQFWDLDYALKDIDVKQKSYDLAQTIYEQNQARFEVGTASRLEVVQVKAEVASRQEELIRSQYTARRVQDQLVTLVTGYDDPRKFSGEIIPAETEQKQPDKPEPFDELMMQSSELRPDLQQAAISIDNRRIELQRSRDRLKPSLEFVGGYQQFGIGGTQVIRDYSQGFFDPPIVNIIPGGLGDALSQTFGGSYYGYVVGLNLQLPLANIDARASNAQAQIELNRAEMQRSATYQAAGAEIRDILTQIEMNEASIEASTAAVGAARERMEGEESRFAVGMGTTRELIEAQRDLLQAETVLLRVRIDLIKSHNRLDRVVGRTLKRQNLVLSDTLKTNVTSP